MNPSTATFFANFGRLNIVMATSASGTDQPVRLGIAL